MAVSTLVDLVKIRATSNGTGPFVLGDAAGGFRGIEALIDGATYSYSVQDGGNFEVGTGAYTAASHSLTRTPVWSSYGNGPVPFGVGISISFTILSQDMVSGPGGASAVLALLQGRDGATTVGTADGSNVEAALATLQSALAGTASLASLAAPTGASLVATKRPEASAVARNLYTVGLERVSLADWGVTGASTSADTAKIKAAFAEAPLGCAMHIPAGVYFMDNLPMTRQFNIVADPNATILGVGSDPTKHVLDIRISPASTIDGSANVMRFDGLRVSTAVGYSANATVNIESQSGTDAAILNLTWIGGRIVGLDAQAGPALRVAGLTNQLHTFQGLDIVNQVLLDGCADAVRLIYNNMYGIKTAIIANVAPGAFKTLIAHNVITAQNGALWVQGASELDVLCNQIEQGASYGPNANAEQASIIIEALSYGLRNLNITGNNFGGGANVQTSLVMKTSGGRTIESVRIGENYWNATNSGVDINLKDSGVKYTKIDFAQGLRGKRGTADFTTYPAYAANNDDVNALLAVTDAGVGTSNVRKDATALGGANSTTLVNGTCSPDLRFVKNADGVVTFTSGYVVAPTSVWADVTIGTLPVGFRPPSDFAAFAVTGMDLAGGKVVAEVVVAAVGTVQISKPVTTGNCWIPLTGISFIAKRDGYDPGY